MHNILKCKDLRPSLVRVHSSHFMVMEEQNLKEIMNLCILYRDIQDPPWRTSKKKANI